MIVLCNKFFSESDEKENNDIFFSEFFIENNDHYPYSVVNNKGKQLYATGADVQHQ